jgi:polyphenol oxidase
MTSSAPTSSPHQGGLSRRTVIKGAAGLAGAASVGAAVPLALGAPAALPVRQDITLFAQNAARLAKFEAAVKEMKARSKTDPDDPKGWLVNAKAHAEYCSVDDDDPKQVHFCWWFLSWHRAYITVTERKIREISGDQTFAYPYWNWSSDRRIPKAYARAGSPLADAIRFTPPKALSDGEVGYFPNDPVLKKLGVEALRATTFEAKNVPQISRSFGGIARPNSGDRYGNNRVEATPHGPVHVYVGGEDASGQGGDMTDFETAARDPIFFAHHGNLDRLWETWRRDPAKKSTEPKTDAFLKHKFVFTWLDGTPMEVAVEDTLDTKKLGYTYDTLSVFRPGVQPLVVAAQSAEDRLPPVATDKVRVPFSPQGAGAGERRILEISDIEKPEGLISVGVYVKPSDAPASDPGVNVGTFAAVRSGGRIAWPSQTLTFDITAAAQRYAGKELTVLLVPNRIRAQGAESYPPLKYGQMRIITER